MSESMNAQHVVLRQLGCTMLTSASSNFQPWFGLDKLCQALILNFNFSNFIGLQLWARLSNNPPPNAKL